MEVLTQRFIHLQMWELCGDASEYDPHGAASAAGPSLARGEHYMFEQCALAVAKAAQETLKRRDEAADGEPSPRQSPEPEPEPEPQPMAGPSEGIPPAAAPSVGTFADLLRQLDVADYADALADEEIRTADDLRDLTMDNLKELGFKMGARNRVIKWSAAL